MTTHHANRIALCVLILSTATVLGVPRAHAQTGDAVPGMESFDQAILDLLANYQVPGAALAVVKDGRLVYARGFGYADVENGIPVQPTSLFRVASLSKPITAIAIMRLVQEGQLDLDAKAVDFLADLDPPAGASIDPRLNDITIRNLLEHSGGWDRDATFDPMFLSGTVAATLGVPAPADQNSIIRYMKGQPLQFDPGSRYAYSNFGYCILGRIIERITGTKYEDYVRSQILEPLGVTRMQIGQTRSSAPGEVKYYNYPGAPLVQSVFPDVTTPVPLPYGGFYIEAMDSHGGWTASPIDYLRVILAADGRPSPPDILTASSVAEMIARPSIPSWQGSDYWYAKGWDVRPVNSDANWWHTGSLPGTGTIVVRAYNGLAWAAFYNSRPLTDQFFNDIDSAMWDAVAGVTTWPGGDQFSRYIQSPGPPKGQSILQVTPDGNQVMVQKDYGTERWSISYDRYRGVFLGNVFKTDGSPPSFIHCDTIAADSQNITFSCLGADACLDSTCPGTRADGRPDWVSITDTFVVPLSFFQPRPTASSISETREHDDGYSATQSAGSILQMTPDGNQVMVQKDYGTERWSISYDRDRGAFLGNVFKTDGSPPSFIHCDTIAADSQNITFSCLGADACLDSTCPGTRADGRPDWVSITDNFVVPVSFFQPR